MGISAGVPFIVSFSVHKNTGKKTVFVRAAGIHHHRYYRKKTFHTTFFSHADEFVFSSHFGSSLSFLA